MPEEPEDVLVHDGVTTTSRIKEGRAEMAVGQCHGDCASQHRHHSDQQISRDQPSPDKHRHLHHGAADADDVAQIPVLEVGIDFLANGVAIHVAETPYDTVGVDTEEDVRRVEEILQRQK